MTVMTDDSFRKLRGKELLVYIYYNIYNTNPNGTPFFNNCHLSSVILDSPPNTHPARWRRNVISRARKLRIRGHEITDSKARKLRIRGHEITRPVRLKDAESVTSQ